MEPPTGIQTQNPYTRQLTGFRSPSFAKLLTLNNDAKTIPSDVDQDGEETLPLDDDEIAQIKTRRLKGRAKRADIATAAEAAQEVASGV